MEIDLNVILVLSEGLSKRYHTSELILKICKNINFIPNLLKKFKLFLVKKIENRYKIRDQKWIMSKKRSNI